MSKNSKASSKKPAGKKPVAKDEKTTTVAPQTLTPAEQPTNDQANKSAAFTALGGDHAASQGHRCAKVGDTVNYMPTDEQCATHGLGRGQMVPATVTQIFGNDPAQDITIKVNHREPSYWIVASRLSESKEPGTYHFRD